jgi:hypothetical protein
VFSGQEYDRYGFIKKFGIDEEEVDPLVVKAEQLERHSEEINNRLKVNTEMPWEYISWFSSVFVTTITSYFIL